jgi:hypothetical protein
MTLIKHLVAYLLLAQLLVGSALAQSTNTITYQADDSNFPNPERGWFVFKELKPTYATNGNNWATTALLDTYYAQGYRLVKHIIRIPTTSGDLPKGFLDELIQEAALVRDKGMKIFYRFNYNWNHNTSNEDAPTDITVKHLEQLKPFFDENADIIAWMEMGFIGYWGEMHTSTSGHIVEKTVGLSDSGKEILYKALDVFPSNRVIGVRYPQIIFRDSNEYGSLGFQSPLTEDKAYDGSYQSRLAAWYANFGAGEKLWHADQEYVAQWAPSTEFVPQWAHCDHFQDLTMDSYEWLDDAQTFHYVALSNPKDENHTVDIYDRWQSDGVYDDYEKYLGYRFRLTESKIDANVAVRGELTLQLTIANDGWARPVNCRPVEVILRNKQTGNEITVPYDPGIDERLWLPAPGTSAVKTMALTLPETATVGNYELLLNFPDAYATLRDNPDYSVRLANKGLWEGSTGYNRLNAIVEVKADETTASTYTIRARGLQGTERMALLIGGESVQNWTVGKSMQNYTYTGSETGAVRIAITNDQGVNHDLVVDKLTVDGTVYQAEAQAINTGVWQKGSCGGSYSQWLHCSGYIEFDLGSANARQASRLEKTPAVEQAAAPVVVYPNPSASASFTVRGVAANAQLYLYDLQGKRMSVGAQRADQQSVLVKTDSSPGLYLLHIVHADGSQYKQKVMLE